MRLAPSKIKLDLRYPLFRGFTLGDAFYGLASKITPWSSTLNFDADVKNDLTRHQCGNPN